MRSLFDHFVALRRAREEEDREEDFEVWRVICLSISRAAGVCVTVLFGEREDNG
jgi:hypothetical protein